MLVDLFLWLHVRIVSHGRERGDVPGWVLITLMTAGLVTVIWTFAGDRLVAIVQGALDNVAPGGSTG